MSRVKGRTVSSTQDLVCSECQAQLLTAAPQYAGTDRAGKEMKVPQVESEPQWRTETETERPPVIGTFKGHRKGIPT